MKFCRKNSNKFRKNCLEKLDIFFCEKNTLFYKIFENHYCENETVKKWTMGVKIWIFARIQGPIRWMCLNLKKHSIPLDNISHQNIWPETKRDKICCQTLEISLFQKSVNLIPPDMNQISNIIFSEKNFLISIFFRNFQMNSKRIGKTVYKILKKTLMWKKYLIF